jgi:hypothetical protein
MPLTSSIGLNFLHIVFQRRGNLLEVFADGKLIQTLDTTGREEFNVEAALNSETSVTLFPDFSGSVGVVGIGFYAKSLSSDAVSALTRNSWVEIYRACRSGQANIDQLSTFVFLSLFTDFGLENSTITGADAGPFNGEFDILFDISRTIGNDFSKDYKLDFQVVETRGVPQEDYSFFFYSDSSREEPIGSCLLSELGQGQNVLERFASEFDNSVFGLYELGGDETGVRKIYARVATTLGDSQLPKFEIDFKLSVTSPSGKTLTGFTVSTLEIVGTD